MKRTLLVAGSDPTHFIKQHSQIQQIYNCIQATAMDAVLARLQENCQAADLIILLLDQADS
ncbi:MAG: hypothetical protein PHR21_10305 [Oscillospiraceae bacterium]|nr:hypothetical protein [Oscillospiraceae bacterium]MDD4368254.1 hypothetical protein [Oscillospiraceae bacterium]